MNFRRSIIIAELWRPEFARRWFFCEIFAFFKKNDPLQENIQNSVSKRFIASPIDVLCSNFMKYGPPEIGKVVRYLTDKIFPKIYQSQPQTVYSVCARFHPNRFTFGDPNAWTSSKRAVKVNLLFGWRLASSLIKPLSQYLNNRWNMRSFHNVLQCCAVVFWHTCLCEGDRKGNWPVENLLWPLAALRSRCGHYIFALWFLLLFSLA